MNNESAVVDRIKVLNGLIHTDNDASPSEEIIEQIMYPDYGKFVGLCKKLDETHESIDKYGCEIKDGELQFFEKKGHKEISIDDALVKGDDKNES